MVLFIFVYLLPDVVVLVLLEEVASLHSVAVRENALLLRPAVYTFVKEIVMGFFLS